MEIIDRGSGPTLVVVPGIQGRWEYLRPAIDALASSFRVLTFSLCGERKSGLRLDPKRGFDNYADQIERVLDERRVDRAAICGVSFGGLAALRFAATRQSRTTALILASTPGPFFRLRKRHEVYARMPWLFGPLFLAETPGRVRREIAAALPHFGARWRFARWQLGTILTAPISLTRMGERGRLLFTLDPSAECRGVEAPTLVVTGEPRLDYVSPVEGTSRYLDCIAGARVVVLEGTGHLGTITKPQAFAELVERFITSETLHHDERPDTKITHTVGADLRVGPGGHIGPPLRGVDNGTFSRIGATSHDS
jgi:pimeloyl-ACP methyl ester carboxylesterase